MEQLHNKEKDLALLLGLIETEKQKDIKRTNDTLVEPFSDVNEKYKYWQARVHVLQKIQSDFDRKRVNENENK